MPSTYAHRRFGADVLERLPAELQEKIAPYRELYDIRSEEHTSELQSP